MIGQKIQQVRKTRRGELFYEGVVLAGQAFTGVLAACGTLFGGLHPLGLAWMLGVAKQGVWTSAVGVMLGYLFSLPIGESLRYLAAVGVVLLARTLLPERFMISALGGAGSLLLVELLLSLSGLSGLQQGLSALCDSMLAVLAGWVVWRGHRKIQHAQDISQQISIAMVFLIPGLERILPGPVSPGILLLVLLQLVSANRGRMQHSILMGLVASAVLTASNPSMAFAGLSVMVGGVAAAYLAPGERIGAATMMLLGVWLGLLTAPDTGSMVEFMASCFLGQAIYLLVPQRVLMNIPAGFHATTAAGEVATSAAVSQLESVAGALSNIADTVNQVYHALPRQTEQYQWVVDYVAEELCRSCSCRELCWLEEYSATMDGFHRLKPVLEQQGRPAVEQLPGQFCRCIHPVELCGYAARGYSLYRSRRESRIKAGAMRSALTEQYTAMAVALGQMAGQLGRQLVKDTSKTDRLERLFSDIGLEPMETQVGFETSGRLQASVTLPRTRFEPEELEELRQEASGILHRKLDLPQLDYCQNMTVIRFSEQPLYTVEFGRACHAAKQEVCGDAVEQFCDCYGNAHLLLCDGMGVGRAAAIDGTLAANLTAQLLKAGFEAFSAARLVNVALSLKSDEESSATVDLVTVDLYSGRTSLFKAGACPTFVVRQGRVETVEGSSLPVGILEQVVGRQQQLQLSQGSWVVLVSDGALADGQEWFCQQLELCAAQQESPQRTAEILADAAAKRQSATRKDDITVTVMALVPAVR